MNLSADGRQPVRISGLALNTDPFPVQKERDIYLGLGSVFIGDGCSECNCSSSLAAPVTMTIKTLHSWHHWLLIYVERNFITNSSTKTHEDNGVGMRCSPGVRLPLISWASYPFLILSGVPYLFAVSIVVSYAEPSIDIDGKKAPVYFWSAYSPSGSGCRYICFLRYILQQQINIVSRQACSFS